MDYVIATLLRECAANKWQDRRLAIRTAVECLHGNRPSDAQAVLTRTFKGVISSQERYEYLAAGGPFVSDLPDGWQCDNLFIHGQLTSVVVAKDKYCNGERVFVGQFDHTMPRSTVPWYIPPLGILMSLERLAYCGNEYDIMTKPL